MEPQQKLEKILGDIFSERLIRNLAENGRIVSVEEGAQIISR